MKMRQVIDSVTAWWKAHAAEEASVKAFVMRYPLQIIIVILALSLFVSCHRNAKTCASTLSEISATLPAAQAEFARLTLYVPKMPEEQYMSDSYPRQDSGLAFELTTSNVGNTILRDVSTGDFIGEVWINSEAQSIVVQVGNVYVGVH